jgi:hypothetical protein
MVMNSTQSEDIKDNPEPAAKRHRSAVKFPVIFLIAAVLIGTGVIGGLIPRWLDRLEKSNVKGLPSIDQAQHILKSIGGQAGLPERHGWK